MLPKRLPGRPIGRLSVKRGRGIHLPGRAEVVTLAGWARGLGGPDISEGAGGSAVVLEPLEEPM